MGAVVVGGARVTRLRKARSITQGALARRAGIPVSLLSKIEIGDRALTPVLADGLARALEISPDALYGEVELSPDQTMQLEDLRSAVRRYDFPETSLPETTQLRGELDHALTLHEHADLAGLLSLLPGLLTRATTHAHTAPDPSAWTWLASLYSLIYWLAARHRWADLIEVAPDRQAWAAHQQPHPLVSALGVQDRVGAFLHSGDFEGGLIVVDRGIVAAETTLTGPDKALATGLLHLRGMTLAGRLQDPTSAQRHIDAAWRAAPEAAPGLRIHYQLCTPANITAHVLATQVDLDHPREALRLAEELSGSDTGLPPTRVAAVHITTARAYLELGDRESAQTSLEKAWTVAPQMANTDPMALELLRVLTSLHQRGNPQLLALAKQTELPV